MTTSLSIGACATLACLWEATAPKPGNVYRGADFEDMTYADFVTSAAVIGPVIDRCGELGLGGTVLEAVQATKRAVGVNTNLGALLLIAPLARAASAARAGGTWTLSDATREDVRLIYEAIRAANPGGLGEVSEGDVRKEPEHTLLEAMQFAAERDLVARQYVDGFVAVNEAAEAIEHHVVGGNPLSDAIVRAHLAMLASYGDSLIARKLGVEVSRQLSKRAGRVLSSLSKSDEFQRALADFDFWLRADGNRRNPGTTADLIAAALFVLLVEDRLSWPVRFYS